MAVEFISYVDEESSGEWFIELKDTLADRSVRCRDLDEYQKSLEQMASEYGNEIEVVWQKSKRLSPSSFNDLSIKMDELKKRYAQEIEQME